MKRRKGFILILAILIMALLVSAMGIVSCASRTLSINYRRCEYDCWQENLQASGRAWANYHRTNITQAITLPTDKLDIPVSHLTISPFIAGQQNIQITSTCGRDEKQGEYRRDFP